MANIDLHGAGVDFSYILLDNYRSFGLNEEELAVLFMIDHLLRQGNSLITSDLLSLKMSLKTHEIDHILSELVRNEYISYETGPGGMKTSLQPLKAKLYKAFERSLAKDRQNLLSEQRASALSRLYTYFEKRLNRVLSPLENDLIGNWLDAGYTEEDIHNALEDALLQKKRSLKSVDKILRSGRIRSDVAKEGYSGVSDQWDQDIERTIEIAKAKWIDDEE
ncbi:MAG: DnaD domain protein [Bacilli bacterium]|nr:DnaD domain protein [Bacilli bacterium]MBR3675097.1 DnaD domain protein [Bacilli bacterium]